MVSLKITELFLSLSLNFLVSATIHDKITINNVPYGAKSNGFLSIFDRHQPFLLFRTIMGAELLNGNGTCYDNETVVPYSPSETSVLYMKPSVQDNYIGWVNGRGQVCTKNLFHSDWNNGIAFDFKDECRPGTVDNVNYISLSFSRHVFYVIGNSGNLYVISLREPTCLFEIAKARSEYVAGKVNALHVTNFNETEEDLVLLGVNSTNQIHVLDMKGDLLYQHDLPRTDILVDIESNTKRNIFLAIRRDHAALVILFKHGLKSNQSEVFFLAPNAWMVSFSASNRLSAILTKQNDSKYTIVFRPVEPGHNSDTEVWYKCENPHGLEGAVIVDPRESPIVKDICKDKPSICSKVTQAKCTPDTVLHFKLPCTWLNSTILEAEMDLKMRLTFVLSLICLIVMGLFQLLPSNER